MVADPLDDIASRELKAVFSWRPLAQPWRDQSLFFGAIALSRACCASLIPAGRLGAVPDFVWPTRLGTDHFHMVSMPCTTLYCLPRYCILYIDRIVALGSRSAPLTLVALPEPAKTAAIRGHGHQVARSHLG
jgi:hypothetical protein